MIRTIGVLLIVLLGWLFGRELRGKIKARHTLICDIDSLCARIISMIRFERLPLDRIIIRYSENLAASDKACGFVGMCAEKINSGGDFHTAWDYAMKNSPDLLCLKPDERSNLSRLGQSLGRSDTDGEISLLEGFRGQLVPLRESAMEELKTKGRALQSCCLLAGIFLAIVII